MSRNIYEHDESLVVCGSCLPKMDAVVFTKIKEMDQNINFVCLESVHMNMVAHKLASILKIGNVNKLIFVSVDKSPHCVQLHYMRPELEKIMDLAGVSITNYVSLNGELIEISPGTISKSKHLAALE